MRISRLLVPVLSCLTIITFSSVSLAAKKLSADPSGATAKASSDDDDLLAYDGVAAEHNIPGTGPTGVYIQAGVGYALTYMSDRIGSFVNTTWKNHDGGFAYGGDLGYQFNNIFAIEAGGVGLPTSTITFNSNGTSSKFKTWGAYLAAKMRVYLYQNTHMYAKAGLSYQQTTLSGSGAITSTASKEHHYGMLLGFGTEYNFTPSFDMSLEYLRFPGRARNTATTTAPMTTSYVPDSNVMLLTLGYMFGQDKDSSQGTL